GVPFGVGRGWIARTFFKIGFHDVKLSPIVLSAYQAVAIDEHRWPFRPALMELKEEHKARIRASQKGGEISPYEQKWFPGAHSNVGGGYPDSQLADCTLKWMIEK